MMIHRFVNMQYLVIMEVRWMSQMADMFICMQQTIREKRYMNIH